MNTQRTSSNLQKGVSDITIRDGSLHNRRSEKRELLSSRIRQIKNLPHHRMREAIESIIAEYIAEITVPVDHYVTSSKNNTNHPSSLEDFKSAVTESNRIKNLDKRKYILESLYRISSGMKKKATNENFGEISSLNDLVFSMINKTEIRMQKAPKVRKIEDLQEQVYSYPVREFPMTPIKNASEINGYQEILRENPEILDEMIKTINDLPDSSRWFLKEFNIRFKNFSKKELERLRRNNPKIYRQLMISSLVTVNHDFISFIESRNFDTPSMIHEILHLVWSKTVMESKPSPDEKYLIDKISEMGRRDATLLIEIAYSNDRSEIVKIHRKWLDRISRTNNPNRILDQNLSEPPAHLKELVNHINSQKSFLEKMKMREGIRDSRFDEQYFIYTIFNQLFGRRIKNGKEETLVYLASKDPHIREMLISQLMHRKIVGD